MLHRFKKSYLRDACYLIFSVSLICWICWELHKVNKELYQVKSEFSDFIDGSKISVKDLENRLNTCDELVKAAPNFFEIKEELNRARKTGSLNSESFEKAKQKLKAFHELKEKIIDGEAYEKELNFFKNLISPQIAELLKPLENDALITAEFRELLQHNCCKKSGCWFKKIFSFFIKVDSVESELPKLILKAIKKIKHGNFHAACRIAKKQSADDLSDKSKKVFEGLKNYCDRIKILEEVKLLMLMPLSEGS